MTDDAISSTAGQTLNGYAAPVLSEDSEFFIKASMAKNTRRAYRQALKRFFFWCHWQNLCPLPADSATVANYASYLARAGLKASTIKLHLVAIRELQRWNHTPLDTTDTAYQRTVKGIWRTIGTAQKGRTALKIGGLRRTIEALPKSIWGVRNKAILLLGWAGALRRSEIVGLDVGDLDFQRNVLVVTLRYSKTDQTGQGDQISIPWGNNYTTCPIRAIQEWLEAASITTGPLFRGLAPDGRMLDARITACSISRMVKRYARLAGVKGDISAHSLRSGFCTTAAESGKQYHDIQRQTRHKSMQTLLKYIQTASLQDSPAAGLGL